MGRKKVKASSKKKATARQPAKTVHKKVPGFDAFSKKPSSTKKYRRGTKPKPVVCGEIIEPEVGIHSLAWAQSIAPQPDCGFLRLPYETRLKIYRHVIDDLRIMGRHGLRSVEPRKNGKKFCSVTWPTASADTERLYMICRQSYVDVVGSGLLYQMLPFSFTSPTSMLNYLLVIHPVHRDAIRTIHEVYFSISHQSKYLHPLALSTLASLPNLQSLGLTIYLNLNLFKRYHNTQFHSEYSVKQEVFDRLLTCGGLVGNGKRDQDGGEGGIRGLKRFTLDFYMWNMNKLHDGEPARYKSVESALQDVMVRSTT